MQFIISEKKYTREELINLQQQGCVVNYTLLPQDYQSYAVELERINRSIIARSKKLIFRLDTLFSSTIQALELALYLKKECLILYEDKRYTLNTLAEWKETTGYGSYSVTYKHPLLLAYEEQRRDYQETKTASTKKQHIAHVTNNVQETEEEIVKLVTTFRYLYDIQVDFDNKADVYLAYMSIKFYLDNGIEYTNLPNSTEDEWCFSKDDESFGDNTYFDDNLYKKGIYADITGHTVNPCIY